MQLPRTIQVKSLGATICICRKLMTSLLGYHKKLALFLYLDNYINMKITQAITALAALAQETRLEIYRFLVKAGDAGLSAGQIGAHFHSSGATVSFHLKTLKHAGLIQYQRAGRSLTLRNT
jgi:hypothetical protein